MDEWTLTWREWMAIVLAVTIITDVMAVRLSAASRGSR
jgi:hypothetical protein